jgi:hypothetical protein
LPKKPVSVERLPTENGDRSLSLPKGCAFVQMLPEEVFFNRPRYRFVESGYRPGEDVYSASGQTDAGRYLIVFFIHKLDNTALILSARDMDKKERRHYERKK